MNSSAEITTTAALPSVSSAEESSYRIACGMLWQDRLLLPLFYILLLIPSVLVLMQHLPQTTALALIQKTIEILLLTVISLRWLKRLGHKSPRLGSIVLAQLLYGFLYWALLYIPFAGTLLDGGEGQIHPFYLVLLVPALFICYRYYFYFFAIALGGLSPKAVIEISRDYTTKHRYLPFKTLLAPYALWFLAFNIVLLPYPDGRSATLNYIGIALSGAPWLLATYLSVAFALTLLDETRWREAHLDPYRDARFATLALQGGKVAPALLTLKNGVKALLISLLLWFGNYVRVFQMHPSPTVEVGPIEVEGNKVRLKLQLEDPKFHFRGFQPNNLALAGETRVVISSHPERAVLEGSDSDVRGYLPSESDKVRLDVEFEASRSGKDLTALQDLYLWYLGAKMMKLDMKGAKVVE